jgi:spindle assembly abnormal protein 6
LYLLDVGEQDYHLLKRDQALLVEFPSFPTKLIELIDLCLETENAKENTHHHVDESMQNAVSEEKEEIIVVTENLMNSTISSFISKLDVSTGVLSVVETNKFKQLTHINLQLRQGNDAAIKAYLAARLKLALSYNQNLTDTHTEVAQSLAKVTQQKLTIEKELNDVKTHKDVDFESLRSNHTTEIANLRISLMNSMDEQRERLEKQLTDCRKLNDELHKEIKDKNELIENGTIELKREKQHLEFRERELTRLLETAEADRDRVFEECKEIQNQKRISDDIRSTLERDLARSNAKNESFELQMNDKDAMIGKSNELVKKGEEAVQLLEEKLDMYIADNEHLHEKIKQGSNEITRGNAVIQKLQLDKKTMSEKMKTKSEVIRKQEDAVHEVHTRMHSIERELLVSQDDLKMMTTKFESAENKLNEANKRLDESAKLVANNQEVISYLNEEINKWQMGMRTGTEAANLGVGISSGFPASGTGIGVSESKSPSKWNKYDQNTSKNSAQMYSPDTTKDITYGGYYDRSAVDITLPQSGIDKMTMSQGLANLGLGDSFVNESELGSTYMDNIPLENMSYYADAEMAGAGTSYGTATGRTKAYAWQSEDFGLENEEEEEEE